MRKALTLLVLVAVLGLLGVVVAGYYYSWQWTGLVDYVRPKTETEEFQRGKTLWDWLSLLVIPIVVAVGGYLFREAEKRTDESIAEQRRKQDAEIASARYEQEQQRTNDFILESTLQQYLDRMSDAMLKENLRESFAGHTIRAVVRARTLTVLSRLDSKRKGLVLQFLHESGLVNGPEPVILLDGADLREANLVDVNLRGANLQGVDLRGANLQGVDLRDADLREADLRGANHEGIRLDGAMGAVQF